MYQSPRKECLATAQHHIITGPIVLFFNVLYSVKQTAAPRKEITQKNQKMGKSEQICQIMIYLLFWTFLSLCISGAELVGFGGSNTLN